MTSNHKECTSQEYGCDTAYQVGQKIRKVVDIANDDMRDVTAAVTKQVRNNPLQASAIAAGVGLLLGLLLRRR